MAPLLLLLAATNVDQTILNNNKDGPAISSTGSTDGSTAPQTRQQQALTVTVTRTLLLLQHSSTPPTTATTTAAGRAALPRIKLAGTNMYASSVGIVLTLVFVLAGTYLAVLSLQHVYRRLRARWQQGERYERELRASRMEVGESAAWSDAGSVERAMHLRRAAAAGRERRALWWRRPDSASLRRVKDSRRAFRVSGFEGGDGDGGDGQLAGDTAAHAVDGVLDTADADTADTVNDDDADSTGDAGEAVAMVDGVAMSAVGPTVGSLRSTESVVGVGSLE